MRRKAIDWSKITITDNYMFIAVFQDPERCRKMLERVLGIKIKEVQIVTGERTIIPEIGARGVRMDVYVDDEAGTVYDVEMQCEDRGAHEKRSRYYLSAIDYDCIERGEPFDELRASYIIFLCEFDPFDRGLVRYTITPHCREDGVEMVDGATRVFINIPAYERCENEQLRLFLRYLAGGTIGDAFTEELDRAVRAKREQPEWRQNRMTFRLRLNEERAEGRAEGKAELSEALKRLSQALQADGRIDDLIAATTDPIARDGLLAEYGIEVGTNVVDD